MLGVTLILGMLKDESQPLTVSRCCCQRLWWRNHPKPERNRAALFENMVRAWFHQLNPGGLYLFDFQQQRQLQPSIECKWVSEMEMETVFIPTMEERALPLHRNALPANITPVINRQICKITLLCQEIGLSKMRLAMTNNSSQPNLWLEWTNMSWYT